MDILFHFHIPRIFIVFTPINRFPEGILQKKAKRFIRFYEARKRRTDKCFSQSPGEGAFGAEQEIAEAPVNLKISTFCGILSLLISHMT
ncbi:MAG TPA: hypothetical protein DEG74_03855 [Clostridiales bacterium]|nr:hypothetical protein [Clostridiales bacterium]